MNEELIELRRSRSRQADKNRREEITGREFIYNIDDITDRAFIDAQYALALIDLA